MDNSEKQKAISGDVRSLFKWLQAEEVELSVEKPYSKEWALELLDCMYLVHLLGSSIPSDLVIEAIDSNFPNASAAMRFVDLHFDAWLEKKISKGYAHTTKLFAARQFITIFRLL
jgi:hypothetical protein